LEAQSASTYQISLKSDDYRLRYSDKTIFKMAAVRHLEFSKFGILVMWPVLERDSALSCKIFTIKFRKNLRRKTELKLPPASNLLPHYLVKC